MPGKPVSRGTIDAVVAAVADGMVVRQAADYWGVSVRSIHYWLRQRGIWLGEGRRAAYARLEVGLGLLAAGASWAEAAEAAGTTKSALAAYQQDKLPGMCVLAARKARPGTLTLEARVMIKAGIAAGESTAQIATAVGCSRSTIWREISRNGGRDTYGVLAAEERAERCSRRPKSTWTESRPQVWARVREWLTLRWSPEQIAALLRVEHPGERHWWVSHEAIYQAIYVQTKGELRRQLASYLRTNRPRRRPHSRASRAHSIPDMVNISSRPAEAADRAVPGHWEGDLIIGKDNQSAVATLVERSTRYGMLVKIDSKKPDHVAERLAAAIGRLPAQLARSLTWDQGTEMCGHHLFTVASNVPVFFCDPHSPWQRGTNENWNGLVRQFLPRSTDLSVHSQEDLDHIARLLNGRPRKTLGWHNPAQQYEQLVALTA